MLTTTEGLFLTQINPHTDITKFKNSTANINEAKLLLMSDIDRKSFLFLNMMESLSDSINKKLCIILASTIDTHKRRYNEYFNIKDENLNDLVVFNNFGSLVVATCKNISQIEVIDENEICQIHIKIKFKLESSYFFGYLTQDGIIRRDSKDSLCDNPVFIQTPNGTLLQRIEGKVTHAKTNKLKFNFYHTIEQPTNLFVHDIKELVVLNDHNQMSVTKDIQEKLEIVPSQYAASSPGIILAAIGAIGQTIASIGKKIVKFFTNALYLLYTIHLLIFP